MILRFVIAVSMSAFVGVSSRSCDLNVYILTGQSNSLGTTELEGTDFDPGKHPADAKTAFYWSNVASSSTDRNNLTLYGDSGGITKLAMQQGDKANPCFWGPEFGLARRLFEAGHTNTMIIKVSRGGGGNTYWSPPSGHMASHLLEQIDIALTAVQNSGKTFEVRGFLYLQGESNNESEAASADARLQSLIECVRSRINTKFSNAAANMHSVIGEIATTNFSAAGFKTTSLQKALAKRSSAVDFVKTNDLPLKRDGIHFGKRAKLEIGRRFAVVLIGQE